MPLLLCVLPQVIMKVDIVYEKEMLYLYVLSSIGGLLLLMLIFVVLYKVGTSGETGMAETARLGKGYLTRVSIAGLWELKLEGPQPTPSFYR